MLIYIYNFLASYVIPGMMLAYGVCLFFLFVPDKEELRNYVFARKVMGATFFVYSLALVCEAVSREPLVGDLLNSMIVVAIGATQAFLFTYSLISLLDIGFLTRRKACRETLVVVACIAFAFVMFGFCPHDIQLFVFYAFSLWYVLLMVRYVSLFRRYYERYRQFMDNYFSDDERQRLRWVPVAFYSAAMVGVVAMLFAWFITPVTQLLFMLTATVYYSVFAVRFMNYVHIFPKIKVPLEDAAMNMVDDLGREADMSSVTEIDGKTLTEDDRALMEHIEQIVREEGLFKNPDLSIANVAALCGKSHRVVSMAINHCRGVNFKTFINEYRVAEASRLIEDGWLKQHTLDALAQETGFASRVNLYRVFKRMTGVSPTDWKAGTRQ